MTRPRLPVDQILVCPSRRGGGPGEPASHPVPPRVDQPGVLAEALANFEIGSIPRAAADGSRQSPFRLGAGGLVVAIVPDQLKAACARRGWSLTTFARRAGISYPTMKSTLRGKSIRPRTAWKLARALGEGNAPLELDQLLEAT